VQVAAAGRILFWARAGWLLGFVPTVRRHVCAGAAADPVTTTHVCAVVQSRGGAGSRALDGFQLRASEHAVVIRRE
jgi:hypothetical protein